ncbi:relaxase/mobilization nuclease domain-containing protein [Deltaproteobacteria bacterium OttesenSCG-928-M10]|nr:relaxase/mobilization nuclease domain-containing protein [Deltaproteobacteria bacterium OttesenSCG-928-M10]
MLPKRIDRKGQRDNYRALALYVADAKIGHIQGEKTLHSWYAGGEADDYLEGMIEVEATQAMNTRSVSNKTYHLMVSFHPEDEGKLTPETLVEIENTLADALGFSDHQRHCGYHVNTANPHLHISYNMINPRTFNHHSPHFDYPKLHRACRLLEQKYGLTVDPGMESDISKQKGARPSAKIRTTESQTGQESLFSYLQRQKPMLMAGLEAAATWVELHTVFLRYGLTLKPSGNGLAIKDRYGIHSVKASALDRIFTKAKLEARFGQFQDPPPDLLRTVSADDRYNATPLHRGADRNGLYGLFQQEMAERKRRLDEISQENRTRYDAIKGRGSKKREEIKRIPMLRHDRQRVMERLREKERKEFNLLRSDISERRAAIREEFPYTSWAKYLRHKAMQGHETALAILRSRNEAVEPEMPEYQSASPQPASFEPSNTAAVQRAEILASHGLSGKHRQALLAVVKMREVLDTEDNTGELSKKLKYAIDAKGTIIFTLPQGGTLRDTGSTLYFSTHGKKIKEVAEKYAQAQWGQIKSVGNKIRKASSMLQSGKCASEITNDYANSR